MRSSSALVLLFAGAVTLARPIPFAPSTGLYAGSEIPPPVESYGSGVPPPPGTEIPPPIESYEAGVPPPAGTEVPPPAESVPSVPTPTVPTPVESYESGVPPPAGTEVPPPVESVPSVPTPTVPTPVESYETGVPPPAGTEVPPPVESVPSVPTPTVESYESGVPIPAGTELPTPEVTPTLPAEVPLETPSLPEVTSTVPEVPAGTEVPTAEPEYSDKSVETPSGPESASKGPQRMRTPANIVCQVSNNGFKPKVMSVTKGDTVTFRVSGGGKFGIRHGGGDANTCVPLETGSETTPTDGSERTMTYTVPEDASGPIYFYNVEGDQCTKSDMSATLNVGSSLVATAPTASGNAPGGSGLSRPPVAIASAASNLPMVALVGAVSFLATLVQL